MAVGSVVSDLQAVNSGAYLDLQPASGVEWVIHNIYWEGASVDLVWYDGTHSIDFQQTLVGPDSLNNIQIHVTNTRWLRVKNNDGGTKNIGYDGVQTK